MPKQGHLDRDLLFHVGGKCSLRSVRRVRVSRREADCLDESDKAVSTCRDRPDCRFHHADLRLDLRSFLECLRNLGCIAIDHFEMRLERIWAGREHLVEIKIRSREKFLDRIEIR